MTTIPKSVDRARYKPGDALNNRILLNAVWEIWGQRCYLNGCVKEAAEFEVEHIIPHTFSPAKVAEILAEYGTSEVQRLDFDVHAPHNLAPACARCNREKTNTNFGGAGQLMAWLDKARKLEPRVKQRVAAYYKRDEVSKALLAMSIADLSDVAARQSLLDLGPLVVARLRIVAPEALTGDTSYDYDDPSTDESERVLVTMDEGSRRASVVLEEVYGGRLDDLLREAVRAAREALTARLRGDIVSQFEDEGHVDPRVEDVAGMSEVEVQAVRFESSLGTFVARGSFWGNGSALVAVDSGNDSGTEWAQGDADEISGTFEIQVSVYDDGTVYALDPELEMD